MNSRWRKKEMRLKKERGEEYKKKKAPGDFAEK